MNTLQWRHNGRDSVSNHQPHDCLLNCLFRSRSKKTSNLRVNGLCAGNSPVSGEFPAQMASNAENVSIWWRHHGGSWIRLPTRMWKLKFACGNWSPFCRRHFKMHFDDNNNYCIWIQISLSFVHGRTIDNKSSLVQVMDWRRTCNKLLAVAWISYCMVQLPYSYASSLLMIA